MVHDDVPPGPADPSGAQRRRGTGGGARGSGAGAQGSGGGPREGDSGGRRARNSGGVRRKGSDGARPGNGGSARPGDRTEADPAARTSDRPSGPSGVAPDGAWAAEAAARVLSEERGRTRWLMRRGMVLPVGVWGVAWLLGFLAMWSGEGRGGNPWFRLAEPAAEGIFGSAIVVAAAVSVLVGIVS